MQTVLRRADETGVFASIRFAMSRFIRCSTVLMLSCVLAILAWPARAAEPQVWISSNDPTNGGAADFWQMFAPNAPWQLAKQHVAVFSIDQNLVTNGPADDAMQGMSGTKLAFIHEDVTTGGGRCGNICPPYRISRRPTTFRLRRSSWRRATPAPMRHGGRVRSRTSTQLVRST